MDVPDATITPDMDTSGLLFVTMQPSAGLDAAVFHEWYNNEHGPIRISMHHIFSHGVRYQAVDDSTPLSPPLFLAVYDVKRMSLLTTKRYTSLRDNRSPREAKVIAQVKVNRLFWDWVFTKADSSFTYEDREPGQVVTVSAEVTLKDNVDGADELYESWFREEHSEMLAKVPGWRRSRLFRNSVIDSPPGSKTVRFVALHDYDADNGLGGEAHQESMKTPRRNKVFAEAVADKQRHVWSLMYVFGSASRDLAHLKLVPSSAAFTDASGRLKTTPGPDAVIESNIVTRDDLSIPYRLEGNASPNAPVVAFSNSLLTSLHMWDPFIAVLKRARPEFQILRYDTRGRHEIPQPPKAADLGRLADDFVELLDALCIKKLDVFIGVSMGGATALLLASDAKYKQRIRRFVAADCNAVSTQSNTEAWRQRVALGERDTRALAQQNVARWLHADNRDKTALADWLQEMVAANSVQGFKYSCTALWDYNVRDQLPSCQVPVLLVVGESDAQGNMSKNMEAFRTAVGKRGAELRILPKVGHLPMCEDAEAFLNAVNDFIMI